MRRTILGQPKPTYYGWSVGQPAVLQPGEEWGAETAREPGEREYWQSPLEPGEVPADWLYTIGAPWRYHSSAVPGLRAYDPTYGWKLGRWKYHSSAVPGLTGLGAGLLGIPWYGWLIGAAAVGGVVYFATRR